MAMTSGAAADEAGVNKETLRFYERIGLIEEPPRDASNYRQYPPETVRRVKFIKRAQNLGFTLEEIETLLDLEEGQAGDREEVLEFAEEKLQDIERQLRELRRLDRVLSDLVEDCRSGDSYDSCPLIEVLTGEDSLEEHTHDCDE